MLVIDSLKKSFNNIPILKEINLSVDPGNFLIIRGANGSGKTTLLKIISGISSFNSGSITYNNIDLNDEIYNDHINYMSDKECLYSHLTVIENLSLFLSMRKMNHDNSEIENKLEHLSILDKKNIIIDHLSSGQIQKVKIARVMLNKNCNLCILDEPEANLDGEGLKKLIHCIKGWKDEMKIILLATHNEELYKTLNPEFYNLD